MSWEIIRTETFLESLCYSTVIARILLFIR